MWSYSNGRAIVNVHRGSTKTNVLQKKWIQVWLENVVEVALGGIGRREWDLNIIKYFLFMYIIQKEEIKIHYKMKMILLSLFLILFISVHD